MQCIGTALESGHICAVASEGVGIVISVVICCVSSNRCAADGRADQGLVSRAGQRKGYAVFLTVSSIGNGLAGLVAVLILDQSLLVDSNRRRSILHEENAVCTQGSIVAYFCDFVAFIHSEGHISFDLVEAIGSSDFLDGVSTRFKRNRPLVFLLGCPVLTDLSATGIEQLEHSALKFFFAGYIRLGDLDGFLLGILENEYIVIIAFDHTILDFKGLCGCLLVGGRCFGFFQLISTVKQTYELHLVAVSSGVPFKGITGLHCVGSAFCEGLSSSLVFGSLFEGELHVRTLGCAFRCILAFKGLLDFDLGDVVRNDDAACICLNVSTGCLSIRQCNGVVFVVGEGKLGNNCEAVGSYSLLQLIGCTGLETLDNLIACEGDGSVLSSQRLSGITKDYTLKCCFLTHSPQNEGCLVAIIECNCLFFLVFNSAVESALADGECEFLLDIYDVDGSAIGCACVNLCPAFSDAAFAVTIKQSLGQFRTVRHGGVVIRISVCCPEAKSSGYSYHCNDRIRLRCIIAGRSCGLDQPEYIERIRGAVRIEMSLQHSFIEREGGFGRIPVPAFHAHSLGAIRRNRSSFVQVQRPLTDSVGFLGQCNGSIAQRRRTVFLNLVDCECVAVCKGETAVEAAAQVNLCEQFLSAVHYHIIRNGLYLIGSQIIQRNRIDGVRTIIGGVLHSHLAKRRNIRCAGCGSAEAAEFCNSDSAGLAVEIQILIESTGTCDREVGSSNGLSLGDSPAFDCELERRAFNQITASCRSEFLRPLCDNGSFTVRNGNEGKITDLNFVGEFFAIDIDLYIAVGIRVRKIGYLFKCIGVTHGIRIGVLTDSVRGIRLGSDRRIKTVICIGADGYGFVRVLTYLNVERCGVVLLITSRR